MEPDTITIERAPIDFQEHDWVQQGYTLICTTCEEYSAHGANIKPGTMLLGNKGEWWIGPEGGLKK